MEITKKDSSTENDNVVADEEFDSSKLIVLDSKNITDQNY